MRTAIHVTHEATHKIGGIGAVLEGLISDERYNSEIQRTILLSCLFDIDEHKEFRKGKTGRILYSSPDNISSYEYADKFLPIEKKYNVRIVYGRRTITNHETGFKVSPEVILVDIKDINRDLLNDFKRRLWEHFGLDSIRYEHIWEYEQYVRLGSVGLEITEAIGAVPEDGECIVIAHEFMGLPTALASILRADPRYHSIFYAHEVATVRKIIEEHPGHDVMFYNVLNRALANKLYIDDVFGPQDGFFKHGLVKTSRFCDGILAVGHYVKKELKFLSAEFEGVDIDVCFNGIPAPQIDIEEKIKSKAKLQRYCSRLLEYSPDYIFSHVSRLAISKGLWRDFLVLEHIEKAFRIQNKSGLMIMLTTQLPSRNPEDIKRMEREYDWPIAHREGLPDLSGGEAELYTYVQKFNAKARNLKVVLINQFGFDRRSCGSRVPIDVDFWDIRKGVDVEFGQSVYEPFGIAMVEPLPFGGICVISSVCGCVGFLRELVAEEELQTVIIPDYLTLEENIVELEQLKGINEKYRMEIEKRVARRTAERILRRLPTDHSDIERYLNIGYNIAREMNWRRIVADYFLPAVEQACRKQRLFLTT